MAQDSVEGLISRSKSAQSVADEWRDLLDDVYEYAIPNRNIINRTQPGEKKGRKVFDSTAVHSTMSFANRIQSDMMPPFQRWGNLVPGPLLPEELQDAAREELGKITEKLFAVIQQSNFDSSLNEMLIDLATGTGAMMIQAGVDENAPVVYTALPIAQLALEEGPDSTVWGIYRTHKVKARLIKPTWPDAKLPDDIEQMITNDKKRNAEVTLIEATYFDNDDKVWRYEVIHKNSKSRLVERESREAPIVTPRWMKIAGETFGRGPLVQALPDIKTLNKIEEFVLKNASLAIAGPYMVTNDGVVNPNTIRLVPNAMIPVSRTAGPNGPSIAPIPRSGDFNIAELERDKLITSIKKMMFDDDLPPQTGAVRSATEIIERVKELARNIGAPFGRLMSEFVVPFIKRTLEVMENAELIEPVVVDGITVQVAVVSPLAQQQNLDDLQALVRWMEIIIGTLGQQGLMLGAKVEDIPEYIGEKLGIPDDLMRDDGERKAMQQMVAQMIAQQQMAAQGGAPAEAQPEQ